MTKMPERIWIEDEFGPEHEDHGQYGSWDARKVYNYVHPYIRADLYDALEAENARLRKERRLCDERIRKQRARLRW